MPEQIYSSRKAQEGDRGTSSGKLDAREPNTRRKTDTAPTVPIVADLISRDLYFATPDCSIQAIAGMMADKNVGSIPVVDNTDRMVPIGIVTDRDIVTRVIARGQDPRMARADQAMSLDVTTIPSTAPIHQALALMQRHLLRHLPVIDDTGCLVGILSLADLSRPDSPAQIAETIRELSEPMA